MKKERLKRTHNGRNWVGDIIEPANTYVYFDRKAYISKIRELLEECRKSLEKYNFYRNGVAYSSLVYILNSNVLTKVSDKEIDDILILVIELSKYVKCIYDLRQAIHYHKTYIKILDICHL